MRRLRVAVWCFAPKGPRAGSPIAPRGCRSAVWCFAPRGPRAVPAIVRLELAVSPVRRHGVAVWCFAPRGPRAAPAIVRLELAVSPVRRYGVAVWCFAPKVPRAAPPFLERAEREVLAMAQLSRVLGPPRHSFPPRRISSAGDCARQGLRSCFLPGAVLALRWLMSECASSDEETPASRTVPLRAGAASGTLGSAR